MLVTDSPEDAVKVNTDHVFILAIVPSEEYINSTVQLSFIEIIQQTFSGCIFCLMKKVSISFRVPTGRYWLRLTHDVRSSSP